MKKLIILFGLVMFSPVFAADDEPSSNSFCIQVMTPAVSPKGVCQEFPTPCDVPSDWKTISSCSLIRPPEKGKNLRDVVNMRSNMRAEALRKKAQLQPPSRQGKHSGRLRIGKTEFLKQENTTRSSVDENKKDSFFNRRAISRTPNYDNQQSYELYKQNASNRNAFKQEPTRLEKYQEKLEESGRRPGFMTSTEMDREGYLSTESFWNQRAMKSDLGDERVWTPFESQKHIKVRTERNNRSGWRGERKDGTLE